MTYKNTPSILHWPLAPARLLADIYFCLRAFTVGTGKAHFHAVMVGHGGLLRFAGDRRRIQREPTATVRVLAASMVRSPLKLSKRQSAPRPIPAA